MDELKRLQVTAQHNTARHSSICHGAAQQDTAGHGTSDPNMLFNPMGTF
jgi:hypothetical protein